MRTLTGKELELLKAFEQRNYLGLLLIKYRQGGYDTLVIQVKRRLRQVNSQLAELTDKGWA